MSDRKRIDKRREKTVKANASKTTSYASLKAIYAAAGGNAPMSKAKYDKVTKKAAKKRGK